MAKAVQGQLLHHSHAPEATEGPSEYQQEQDLILTGGRWFHTVYCAKHSRFVPSLSLAEREEAAILQSQLCPAMVTCSLWEREGTVIEWAGSGHTHNTCPNPTLSSEMQVEDAPWGTRWLSSRH